MRITPRSWSGETLKMEAAFEAAAMAAAENEADMLVIPIPAPDKKSNLWMTGVLSCMTSVLRIFGRADLMYEYDEEFYIKPERVVESQCIGEGAQGKVHLATLKVKDENQTVAIKYVQAIDDMTVRHLRNISHVNIVQTLGVCINPPKYFIVMEYCENGSLFDYMRQGITFTPKQMIDWARGIACGMRHIHDKNIIHRDLKSPNVLITADLIAKVSDFGTSRTIDGHSKVMTFVGTLNWMAPEMLLYGCHGDTKVAGSSRKVIRAEKYSDKVDVWSFGVVLWEMVTLQIPYYKMEQHAIMWGVGTDSVSLPIPPGLPNSIHVLLVQCWNRRHPLRPTFAMIIKSLDLIAEELMLYDQKTFLERQNVWARDTRNSLEMAFLRSEEQSRKKIPAYTQLDLYSRRDLKDKRHALDQRMDDTNDLFFEICSVRLALETRERELAQKEKLVEGCNCGVRKVLKLHRQLSSSSDGTALNKTYRAMLKKESKLLVNLINNKTVTTAIDDPCICEDKINHNKIRNDNIEGKKDTVVEINGNVDIKTPGKGIAFGQKVCAVAEV